jgi:hypothetical protein
MQGNFTAAGYKVVAAALLCLTQGYQKQLCRYQPAKKDLTGKAGQILLPLVAISMTKTKTNGYARFNLQKGRLLSISYFLTSKSLAESVISLASIKSLNTNPKSPHRQPILAPCEVSGRVGKQDPR